MSSIDSKVLEQLAQALASNPSLFTTLQQLVANQQLPQAQATAQPLPTPSLTCPAIPSITLCQATLYNNGEKGERMKYEQQFKLTLELWTKPADQIRLSEWQWKRSIVLEDYWTFVRKLDTRKGISGDYREALGVLCDYLQPRPNAPYLQMIGLIGDKGIKGTARKGTSYYGGEFVTLKIDQTTKLPLDMVLWIGSDSLDVAPFVRTDCKGNPLKGKAKAQARLDLCDYHASWGSAE